MPQKSAETKQNARNGRMQRKTRKHKEKTRPVSFAEEKDSDEDRSNSSGKKSDGSKPPAHHKDQGKGITPEVKADAVANPVPDTGISRTTYYATIPTHTASSLGLISAILTSATTSKTSQTMTMVGSLTMPSVASLSPTASAVHSQATKDAHEGKRSSTVVIVILSILAAFALFGILAGIWVYTRPKKRSHPTPSLPILQDDYSDTKVEPDEESLFGGKERSSARPGSNGILWTWTQYSHTPSTIAPLSKAVPVNSVLHNPSAKRGSFSTSGQSAYPFHGHGSTPNRPPSPPQPLQQISQAMTRAANRVSTVSMSIYPTSPQTSAVGVAVTDAPLTADGAPVMQRSASKASTRRHSRGPKSTRQSYQSTTGFDMIEVPGSHGRNMPSPKAPPIGFSASSIGGRAKVQGPYASAVSMRTSASASAPASHLSMGGSVNPFDSSEYTLPPVPPVTKTDVSRERDTKALASALGLSSPNTVASPQPTLYPDDSITLAGDRRRSRGHGRMKSHVVSPTLDPTSHLGNLMLADFQSNVSLSTRPLSYVHKGTNKKRMDDKPPRVPSPPPMPSLAQMALEHGNPDAFADYRSPTYSIYGLYEMDRKSRLV
ncbi:hypothetical protein K474DRAFT_808 [Panus rudis PR-1116 ss-1]|nr:hypothetical protein K474DRAFT_808 [Panus rudis PR-1116 ss-1]